MNNALCASTKNVIPLEFVHKIKLPTNDKQEKSLYLYKTRLFYCIFIFKKSTTIQTLLSVSSLSKWYFLSTFYCV